MLIAGCGSDGPASEGGSGNGGAGGSMSGAGTSGDAGSTAGSGSDTAGTGGASGGRAGSTSAGSSGSAGSKAGTGGSTAGSAGTSAAGGGAGGAAGETTAGTAGSGGSAGGAGGATGGSSGGSAGGSGGFVDGTLVEEEIADTPSNWQEHSVAAANGEVFVLGGYNPNATSNIVAYDPEGDSWRDVGDFIGPFNHANVGVVDEKIYVMGFYEAGTMSQASAQTFVYDPVADDWNELTPMPADTERAAGCVARLGTRLYVFGGGRDNAVVDDVSSYDTATDSWDPLPALPETREHCAAGAIDGKLYVGGGRSHTITEFRPKTWQFDPVEETYTEMKPIPTPRGGCAGAVYGNRLFVFGGEGNADSAQGVFGNVEAYDPASDSWEEFPPLMVPRHGFQAAVLDGRVYLPGGANRQGGGAFNASSVLYFE